MNDNTNLDAAKSLLLNIGGSNAEISADCLHSIAYSLVAIADTLATLVASPAGEAGLRVVTNPHPER